MKTKLHSFQCTSLPLALLALVVSPSAQAQNTTTSSWSGTTDTVWGTSTNWGVNGVPSATASALFNSTFSNQPSLGASQSTQGIWLTTGAGQDVTINSSAAQTLTITGTATLNSQTNAGIYMNDSANRNLTIGPNTGITLSNNTGFYNQQSSTSVLAISGGLNLNGKILTIGAGATSTGNASISGNITGAAGAITINTAGTVTLSGTNTNTGVTSVTAGTLILSNKDALGSGGLTLNGGVLQASADLSGANALSRKLSVSNTTISGSHNITFSGGSVNPGILVGGGDRTLTNDLDSGKALTISSNSPLGITSNPTGRTWVIAGSGATMISANLINGGGPASITISNASTAVYDSKWQQFVHRQDNRQRGYA